MFVFFFQEKMLLRNKVVVALYPFKAIEGGDLSLDKVNDSFKISRCFSLLI